MKLFKKTFLCVLAAVLVLVSLTSCIDRDTALETINDFWQAVEKGNLETAKTHLHPDKPLDLEKLFADLESKNGIDFQSDIEILKYTNVKTAHRDSDVDGSLYSTTFDAKIDSKEAKITMDIVENDNGYGIYSINIKF